jgi:hypothetical protein
VIINKIVVFAVTSWRAAKGNEDEERSPFLQEMRRTPSYPVFLFLPCLPYRTSVLHAFFAYAGDHLIVGGSGSNLAGMDLLA